MIQFLQNSFPTNRTEEYEDEDGNLVEYAYWEQMIWQEKPPAWPREEGIWFWAMTCSDGMIANPNAWPVLIELAEASSEQARTSCTVPFTP